VTKGGEAVDRETMAAAKASYDRCCTVPRFFEDFYRNFFARNQRSWPGLPSDTVGGTSAWIPRSIRHSSTR